MRHRPFSKVIATSGIAAIASALIVLALPRDAWAGTFKAGSPAPLQHPGVAGVPARFEHIVIAIQENRTPDSLFRDLCQQAPCGTGVSTTTYNIKTSNWPSSTGVVQPQPMPLPLGYDMNHSHGAFRVMCDYDAATNKCLMDKQDLNRCVVVTQPCPADHPNYYYVDNSGGAIQPYIDIALQYGFANAMFSTCQCGSFPGHQFLFGATSALSADDDHNGYFMAENPTLNEDSAPQPGCDGDLSTTVNYLDPAGSEKHLVFPCAERQALSDLLEASALSWRYYTPKADSVWTAPEAIDHICGPANGTCAGSDFLDHVDTTNTDVLTAAANCTLPAVSWVIPDGHSSDHAGRNNARGPSWIASIVNAVGESACTDANGLTYWQDTAIVVTWDDWGGWYDHVAPLIEAPPQKAFQMGMRLPLLFVSAYTPQGTISANKNDFAAIINFVESNYGMASGSLTFADARTNKRLSEFYSFSNAPRAFVPINAPLGKDFFLKHRSDPAPPPDDD